MHMETSAVNRQWKITTSIVNYRRFSSSLVNCRGVIFVKYWCFLFLAFLEVGTTIFDDMTTKGFGLVL